MNVETIYTQYPISYDNSQHRKNEKEWNEPTQKEIVAVTEVLPNRKIHLCDKFGRMSSSQEYFSLQYSFTNEDYDNDNSNGKTFDNEEKKIPLAWLNSLFTMNFYVYMSAAACIQYVYFTVYKSCCFCVKHIYLQTAIE